MIRFVVHAAHRLTMLPYLERWAGPFRSHIEMVAYDQLFRTTRLPVRAHVFTDIERLGADDLERAAKLFETLRSASPDLPLLNHPLRVRRRYELLRTLHDAGINDFNVYRLSEARKPRRFPVFLRSENDHAGPETELITSQADLDVAVEAFAREGKSRETKWGQVAATLEKLGISADRIAHLRKKNDPALVAKVVEEILSKE